MRLDTLIILSLLVYLDSYVPNSYSVNYTFPYSSTLLESRKDLTSNIFQPSGTTLPSMEDLPTIEYQPTKNDLPIMEYQSTQEYQPTMNPQPTKVDLPTIKNQPTTEESQCQVKILNNFPQIPHNRKTKLKSLIAKQWESKQDMDFFNCYTFDFLNKRESQELPTLYEVVLKHKVNNTIILMYTDKGYMNNLVSSYYSSKLYHYSNLIVVCGDIECYHALHQKNIHVVYINMFSNIRTIDSQFSEYGSKEFRTKQQWKMNFIMACLLMKVKVLYMDSDIYLLRNPLPYLENYHNLDFVAQIDIRSICTGFVFFWPTISSIKMLDVARDIRAIQGKDDQDAINAVVEVIKEIHYQFLPSSLFMSGDAFFNYYQHSWDLYNSSIYMWHNNYVVGKIAKGYRAKEMGFYLDDTNSDYNSNTARYFTIHLVHSRKAKKAGKDKNIERILQRAATIANSLNRSFVIPPSTCKTNEQSFCNLCYYDIWCFINIVGSFALPFKESTFFADSRVPIKYRTAFNNSVIYDFSPSCQNRTVTSTYPPYYGLTKQVSCVACMNGNIVNCIINFFSSRNDDVIEVMSV